MDETEKDKIRLAFSMYSSPGAYALLLGSGVSKSARIKTGWEIMLDLIQQIAKIKNVTPENPLQWYQETFEGEDPTYDNLLDRVARKSVERRNILSRYFDPSQEDMEDGRKIPQGAHIAIAKLVKLGFIKVILTTNFDRLLESALLSEGIHPYLIYNDDAIDGCLPPVHIRDSCIIYKIHGDYKDSRLRNTPNELKDYPEKVNRYLERIFEDFGLIVCGWSAEWDVALRKAICKQNGNRSGVYWTLLSTPKRYPEKIIDQLGASTIYIKNADDFFETLYDNIESLRSHVYPRDPLSTPIAIEKTKRYISENNSIKLFDLINNERVLLLSEVKSERFEIEGSKLDAQGKNFDEELYFERLTQYEELLKPLCSICGIIAYFDDNKYTKIISSTMENLVFHRTWYNCLTDLKNLENYPLYLLSNVVGAISLANQHYNMLAASILKPISIEKDIRGIIYKYNIIELLKGDQIIDYGFKYEDETSKQKRSVIYHVYDYIFDRISDLLPNKLIFIEELQKYNFLLAMVLTDLKPGESSDFEITPYLHEIGSLEYYKEKARIPGNRIEIDKEGILGFFESGKCLGNEWGLIKAGFFSGNIDRFNKAFLKVSAHEDFK